MIEEINKRLNRYLEFDNSELFSNCVNGYDEVKIKPLIRIFGGAIRDSIAGDPINDVDILCGKHSVKFVENVLTSHGYKYKEKLATKDMMSLYSDIHVISEPKTWMKGEKIVQLIRPVLRDDNIAFQSEKAFSDLISNVDLSCCGLSFEKNILYENYKNAIIHSVNKCFYVNKRASMYSVNRAAIRTHKMLERGWQEIETDDLRLEDREMILNLIIDKSGINIKYESEH